MKNAVTVRLRPQVASFLAERGGERAGIEACVELCQMPVLALRFTVHGVLQSLDELLEVRDTLLKVVERRGGQLAGRRLSEPGDDVRCRKRLANVLDSRCEPLGLAAHRLPRRLGTAGRGG